MKIRREKLSSLAVIFYSEEQLLFLMAFTNQLLITIIRLVRCCVCMV